ncbi:hypothetical protein M440DRAFT_1404132 [Trichoderma longibrachiatum ATCC 18648]|uniref:Uncharacterized protein n=1 Tax=Trichoderma longibrachiatum ATCC 18648 TaxID=983965 RepID=A0A2T4BX54_TRILO|nr:hypothetical protein M440DRAFT_1404132 [Trichoderma longibrachiatum ATCC 18648]
MFYARPTSGHRGSRGKPSAHSVCLLLSPVLSQIDGFFDLPHCLFNNGLIHLFGESWPLRRTDILQLLLWCRIRKSLRAVKRRFDRAVLSRPMLALYKQGDLLHQSDRPSAHARILRCNSNHKLIRSINDGLQRHLQKKD